ncbi:phosphoribosylaminoimidazole carboxylase [Bacillus atrophaeus]|uniref:AbaSI family restriction endonuclease n=1 Tax=Bacillus atrophaeus TaxID=1452 RepID=UPI001EFBD882|nr:phosphoribosylaminoimidazole carboxylase [Bacillus atrophaeus]MCG8396109.1 phosphoribosylaminoimidazole carboxylase [Bacillus atrophaeus]
MKKYNFIKAQLAKTNKKNDENYVITRILHKLDNLDVKFITQQYVVRDDGGYALTDMYFPQIGVHIEVDEPHHIHQIIQDEIREKDIVSITNHEILRVDVSEDLNAINSQIDYIIQYLNKKISELGKEFEPWNIERENDPKTYINKGYIDLKENVAFEKCVDVCNCFGHYYKSWFKGGAKHPYLDDTRLWFPKLYPNDEWDNSITSDELIIREKSTDKSKVKAHMEEHIDSNIHNRIVFAKVKGPLGDVMYRFKGEYKLNIEQSYSENCLVWERSATRVKTYKPKIR